MIFSHIAAGIFDLCIMPFTYLSLSEQETDEAKKKMFHRRTSQLSGCLQPTSPWQFQSFNIHRNFFHFCLAPISWIDDHSHLPEKIRVYAHILYTCICRPRSRAAFRPSLCVPFIKTFDAWYRINQRARQTTQNNTVSPIAIETIFIFSSTYAAFEVTAVVILLSALCFFIADFPAYPKWKFHLSESRTQKRAKIAFERTNNNRN